jgi:hypothetical protein
LERVSVIEGSGSDLTGVSDSSSSVPQVQVTIFAYYGGTTPYPDEIRKADVPFPEEEMVQRELDEDEDLAIPDSPLRATTPPSTHEGDIPPSIAPNLSPVPSPVGTDYVDEHIDLHGSPQLPHESPDPLDIITPAEEDSERDPSPTHERPEVIQSSSPSQPFESSDGAMSAEPEHSSIAEPPEMAEDQHLEPSEVVERSEAEVEIESDEPAAVSNSNPVEGETSAEDKSDMVWKDDASTRLMSEPSVVHAVGSPLSFGDTTTSVACTLETGTRKTEPDGGHSSLSSNAAELRLAEATGMFEVEDKIQLDESRPEETQVKQDDEMEIERENSHEAASPVAEQSRHNRKPRKLYRYSMLTIIQTSGKSQGLRVYSQILPVTEKKLAKTRNPSTRTNRVCF